VGSFHSIWIYELSFPWCVYYVIWQLLEITNVFCPSRVKWFFRMIVSCIISLSLCLSLSFDELGFEQSIHIEPLHEPLFCDGFFFQDRVSWTIRLGCLWTAALLISAFWVPGLLEWSPAPGSSLLLVLNVLYIAFLFLVRLKFKLRTSWLESRLSFSWTRPPVHFAMFILWMGLGNRMSGLTSNLSSPDLSLACC
jgi:hypothetical protein